MTVSPRASLPCLYAGPLHTVFTVPRVSADCAVFCCALSGTIRTENQLPVLQTAAGSYMYFPQGGPYSLRFDCESAVVLHISLPEGVRFDSVPAVYSSDEANALFHKLAAVFPQAGQSAVFSVQSLVFALLAVHSALYTPENGDHARILAGTNLLEREYLANDPVSRYAAESGMQESRFRALFQKVFGCLPVDYRNRLRLTRAQSIIHTLGIPVNAAAAAAGFNSASYFSRQYKKTFGVNPAAESEENDGQMG